MIPQKSFVKIMEKYGHEPVVIKRYIKLVNFPFGKSQYRIVLGFKSTNGKTPGDTFQCDCEAMNAEKIQSMWYANRDIYRRGRRNDTL